VIDVVIQKTINGTYEGGKYVTMQLKTTMPTSPAGLKGLIFDSVEESVDKVYYDFEDKQFLVVLRTSNPDYKEGFEDTFSAFKDSGFLE